MARRDAYVVAGAVIAVLCISSLRLSTSRSRAAPPPVAHAAALTELGLVAERLATTAARQEKTLASLASSASATRSAVAAFERGDVADGAAAARAAEATRGGGGGASVARPSPERARARAAERAVAEALARAPSAAAPAADGATVDGARAFVFVAAGLEGTGHHWYKSLFEQCGRRCRPSLVGPLAWQRAAAVFNSKMAADAPAAELAARRAGGEGGEGPGATTWILNALGGRNDDAMAALKKRAPLAWTEGEGMASYRARRRATVFFGRRRRFAGTGRRLRVRGRDPRSPRALAAQVDALPPPPLALCDHFAFEDLAKGDAAALARLGPFLGLDDAGALARVKRQPRPPAPGPKDAKGQRDRATLVAQLAAAQDRRRRRARQRRRA
ncbi:hypothetical protein SO694_00007241 [Aureococcus anophagefferens]|uniref:Sulfotransferase domain-containing protein n=1 Tax=Aureococcus anophagefferens TaxID=44056 RepID=A0ABR1GAS7_AURAN